MLAGNQTCLAVNSVPDGEALESGWEELGIPAERAAEIADEMTEEGGLNVEFYQVKVLASAGKRRGGGIFLQ